MQKKNCLKSVKKSLKRSAKIFGGMFYQLHVGMLTSTITLL